MKRPGGNFTKNQISEDTERMLRGREPKYNAVEDLQDEEPTTDAGKMPTTEPPEKKTDGLMPQPGEKQPPATLESLAAENLDLKQRLERLEEHVGLGKEPDADQDDEQGFGQARSV